MVIRDVSHDYSSTNQRACINIQIYTNSLKNTGSSNVRLRR
jgi:hypothetical protein